MNRGTARRLATIVSLDVAGYSARTEADESSSVADIARLRGAIGGIVRKHHGRIFNSAGDGFMLEFPSSVSAVEAALQLANSCRPQLRIGVHLGDVVVQPDGDLLGHGVNVAARLMAQAKPGSVLVSATVFQALHAKARQNLSPRGRIKLDKMNETVEAFAYPPDRADQAVATSPSSAPASGEPQTQSPQSKPSVAVLPFVNLSGADQNYFAEGMTEEVITALSRIRSIFVIGYGSYIGFKDKSLTAADAGARLGVRYILEGSVRRSGAKVRIAAKVTDVRDGIQIWAERFDGTMDDIFALQDRVALSIAGVIEPAVHAIERRQAARQPVDCLGCYDLYLQAAALRATLRKDEVLKAIELLERALALEPDFAPALGQAASCHSLVVVNNWSDDPESHRREGLQMAERAILHGSGDAAVLAQTANALMELDNDLSRARALIDRATNLNPGSAYAWFVSGIISLLEADGDAAARSFHEAARLDPLSSLGEMARAHMAMARFVQGNFAEAARVHRETTYRTPRIHLIMAAVHGHLGNREEARRELALYGEMTAVPAEVMANRIPTANIRARALEGLRRARE